MMRTKTLPPSFCKNDVLVLTRKLTNVLFHNNSGNYIFIREPLQIHKPISQLEQKTMTQICIKNTSIYLFSSDTL